VDVEIGYWLSSEEHAPSDLVRFAQRAEDLGFSFALISDHFHPWLSKQGHSPFVWSVLGGIAHATRRLRLGTAVTCPIMRMHPAIIAQAAATVARMLPDRFFLGVGSGENLNEHILADHWPTPDVRQDMLEEAIEVMQLLWQGGSHSHDGVYFQVEEAQVFTLPATPIPVMVAASGPHAAELAGRQGDGLISVAPNKELVERFRRAGGEGKPCYGQVKACWATDEATARRTAHEIWPNGSLPGGLNAELRAPVHFEAVVTLVTEQQVAKKVVCGPDPERYVAAIREYADAGFSHVSVHQIGPDQEGFFSFFEREVMPRLR
jgi:coenzyme F420-dependent glucose-6-phosphate dehydrogenase